MFLTEIKNVGKPDVEIDVKYSERDQTVRYRLLAISALSYTENQGGATGVTENQGGATGVTENQGGATGATREPGGVTGVNKNCVDKIMDFLENTLKIEDTKSIQIEKA